ncbi:MAG: hypothetical protein ACJ739_14485 [Acidimicrobiales bacterium]
MDWAAPDAAVDAPRPPDRAPWQAAAPAGPDRPLPALAPMTMSDLLDGGFAIIKRAPATIVGLTALFVVPIQLLAAFLNRGVEGFDLDAALQETNSTFEIGGGPSTGSGFVLQVGSMLALVVVAAAIARLVSAWYVGHDLTTRELLRGTLPIAWPLFASWVLVHVLEGVSIIGLGVLPLAVMTWFLVTAPVIGAEGLGPIQAMRRSARLVQRRFWNVLGAALLGMLVESLFESAVSLLPQFVSFFVGTEGIAWVLPAVVGVVTQLVTMPFVAAVTVLIYLDLRVRTEALDLELRAGEAFAAA